MNVAKIAAQPSKGTAMNAPNGPTIAETAAIVRGKPAEYVGTIVAGCGPGR
jgi:hypothetical protein